MKTTVYNSAKQQLKQVAIEAKAQFKNDKPAIRQTINDYCDSLCREWNLSESQRDRLFSFACTLHPKN